MAPRSPGNSDDALDHDVTLESGVAVRNPMRVFQHPGVSDEEFAEDVAAGEKDLRSLKQLLENSSRR